MIPVCDPLPDCPDCAKAHPCFPRYKLYDESDYLHVKPEQATIRCCVPCDLSPEKTKLKDCRKGCPKTRFSVKKVMQGINKPRKKKKTKCINRRPIRLSKRAKCRPVKILNEQDIIYKIRADRKKAESEFRRKGYVYNPSEERKWEKEEMKKWKCAKKKCKKRKKLTKEQKDRLAELMGDKKRKQKKKKGRKKYSCKI